MKKKKILIVGQGVYPIKIAGSEIAIYNFAKSLNQSYNLSLTLNISKSERKIKELQDLRISTYNPNYLRKSIIINQILKGTLLFLKLVLNSPDLILSFMILENSLISLIYAKIFKKKIIVRSEGSDLNYINSTLNKLMKGLICKKVDLVLFTSPTHESIIKNFKPKKKPIFLGNGSQFISKPDLNKENYNNPNKITNFIFVGNLRPVKNVKTIIDAIKILNDDQNFDIEKIRINICGDGSEKNEILGEINDFSLQKYINMHGKIPHEEIKQFYLNSDILILPSYSEGFPLVIAEALSFGLGIICSNIPNLKKILKSEENCLFFNPKNGNQLALAIKTLCENNEMLINQQRNNYKLSSQYSWTELSKKLKKIIEKELSI